jgi:hypothetical protein
MSGAGDGYLRSCQVAAKGNRLAAAGCCYCLVMRRRWRRLGAIERAGWSAAGRRLGRLVLRLVLHCDISGVQLPRKSARKALLNGACDSAAEGYYRWRGHLEEADVDGRKNSRTYALSDSIENAAAAHAWAHHFVALVELSAALQKHLERLRHGTTTQNRSQLLVLNTSADVASSCCRKNAASCGGCVAATELMPVGGLIPHYKTSNQYNNSES